MEKTKNNYGRFLLLWAGEFISSDDTVCVIYSRSGKIYTGSSRTGNYMNPLSFVTY